MRAAYADPPYIGCAHRYPENEEVDHVELFDRLGVYDAWALSCSSPSLPELLQICPYDDVRIMAWVKPFAVFKPNVNPAYCWEPVLVKLGKKRTREQPTVRDWVSESITLKKGLVGAKPVAFCQWILLVLNLQEGDTLDDLYPGTGIMTKVWESRTETSFQLEML